jgi:AraC-like DNA-binding protein
VWDAVLADPAQAWTLGDLARLAGCSIESLRIAVQEQTGHSPMAHVTWLRIRRASSQLLLGDMSVAQIAAEVGYENPFAFSVAFKRLMGFAPAVYRGQRHGQYLVPGDPQGKPPSRGGRGVNRQRKSRFTERTRKKP